MTCHRLLASGLIILSIAALPCVWAESSAPLPADALAVLRRIVIQHNGRNKPLDSFARETLQLIAGEPRIGHDDPVQTVFSIMADPERWQEVPLVSVPFMPLREGLGMDRKASRISYNDLVASRKLMRMLPSIVEKQRREEKLSILENETMDAFQRFAALSGLLEQKLNLVPSPRDDDPVWLPVSEPSGYASAQQDVIHTAWTELMRAVRASDGPAVTVAARHFSGVLQQWRPHAYSPAWRIDLEVFYNHVNPFRIAQLLYLLAIIALVLGLSQSASSWARVGLWAVSTAFIVHGTGIAMRVVIGGPPPGSHFF